MLKNIIKNKNYLSILVSTMIFIVVFLGSNFFYTIDKSIQNNYYKIKNIILGTKAHKSIIVVEIDEKTLDLLGLFPFSRDIYPQFIENLKNSGVGVIGFDILFIDKTDKIKDSKFANSIKKAGNIVLGLSILDSSNVKYPLSYFKNSALGLGYFPPNIDKKNNSVYSIKPFAKFRNTPSYIDHFSFSVLKAFYSYIYNKNFNNYKSFLKNNYYFLTPNTKVPLARNNKNEVLINFIDNKKFKKVSFVDIYNKKSFNKLKKSLDFKDKIILVGTAADGIKDIFYTPNGIEYGVYIHANMLNTVLNRSYLVYFDKKLEWLLIFLLIIISVYFNLSRSSYVLVFSNISIFIIFLLIFPVLTVLFTNLIINFPLELIFALILSFTSSNIIKYLIENKNKQKLNKALSEYVSHDIASEILSGAGKINLNGEKKEVAVFFSDIEGFTTISEKLSPENLVSFLKEYLGSMSTMIIEERGFIDKYEGDAVMAIRGAFSEKGDYCYQACNSALAQTKTLRLLNKKFKESIGATIKVRIGINFGEVILGNIGAKGKKMEFTALGDNVNLASRLEGVNKFYGTYLCVSETVYNKVKGDFEFRFLDKIRVKGKNIGIKIYELIDYKNELTSNQISILSDFEKALNMYFKMDFKNALDVFEKLILVGDMPSKTFALRCKNFILSPPSTSWDGIREMMEK